MIKNAWILGKDFFFDRHECKKALILLVFAIVSELCLVYMYLVLTYWHNSFYGAIQNLDKEAFYQALIKFVGLLLSLVTIATCRYLLQSALAINWRKWMTEQYLNIWFHNNGYLGMSILNTSSDNPDQRISEDIKSFITLTISLTLGLLNSVITLISFSTLLWSLSGPLELSLLGLDFSIPGYLFWVAIIYSIMGTFITYVIGKKLSFLDYLQEKKEADFRFSMMRLRENAESIALYRGVKYEMKFLQGKVKQVISNFKNIIRVNKNLNIWKIFYINIDAVIPILAAAPKFFAKEITLGDMMQIRSTFDRVCESFSFLVHSFADIAAYRAVVLRLTEFRQHIEQWDKVLLQHKIEFATDNSGDILLEGVNLLLPTREFLIKDLHFTFKRGCSYLITGHNGIGKSMLIKVIAGIWPFCQGKIVTLPQQKIFFIPQKIYMPYGTLAEAIAYPMSELDSQRDDLVKGFLDYMGLSHLIARLHSDENWSLILSLGEQQKIAVLRAVLSNPDMIIMDEFTSALTESDEALVHKFIKDAMPGVSIISVGHRGTLARYYDHKISVNQMVQAVA